MCLQLRGVHLYVLCLHLSPEASWRLWSGTFFCVVTVLGSLLIYHILLFLYCILYIVYIHKKQWSKFNCCHQLVAQHCLLSWNNRSRPKVLCLMNVKWVIRWNEYEYWIITNVNRILGYSSTNTKHIPLERQTGTATIV